MIYIDELGPKLKSAEQKLKEVSQGRAFNVGVRVLYREKFGVVTDLNQGSEDPSGSTVDIRLSDGKVIEGVKVTDKQLQRFRA